MKVVIQKEEGTNEALLGMALSYWDGEEPLSTWWTEKRYDKAFSRSKKLAFKQGGHNKFLESIQLWFTVKASRAFWSEFDTYRVGVTKQSASTMHTLKKRKLTKDDFTKDTLPFYINEFNSLLGLTTDINRLKDNLPEGFLQSRVICTNYKALQGMIQQRKKHRLKEWPEFCEQIMEQTAHPYYLIEQEL